MQNIQIPDQIYARLKAWSGARNQTVEEALIPIFESLVTRDESPVDNAGKRKALQEMLEFMRERAHRYPPGFRTVEDRGEIYEVS
jgi:hypothetical protein